MTTITREQLIEKLQNRIAVTANYPGVEEAQLDAAIFKIALASLEAKPIGAFHIADQQVDGTTDYIKNGEWPIDNGVIEVYAAPPAPVVPEKMNFSTACNFVQINGMAKEDRATLAMRAWNACRSAMLQSKYRDLSQPVDPQISEYEKIMQRAGWVMVPVEPTDEMIEAAMNCEDVLFNSDESFCVQFGNIYEAMLAAAPQHEVK
ncbi:hypothetical protein I8K73_002965 [Salmonella enterica]|nr:hypothetical protein [Salmonella enterica]ECM5610597.1 hypothetical protein [Salmonella enterica subsp. enterica serovar Newport]EBE0025990.1 hypothetical protein [Salmonella enterica]ECP6868032.1 hypothetical protein [Salmonella enterica]ECS7510633.1 hypothetical protein [Salmonella enterica subsp. enterica serovar Newport]